MKTLAEKIRTLRNSNNLTQEEFAKKMFVSREAVSKWEQGRGIPDIENLKNISKIFNVSLDSLLDMEITTQLTINNINAIGKIKKIQVITSSIIAVCLVFLIVFGLLNFNQPRTLKLNPKSDMPEGVLIGFYIDVNNDTSTDLKELIDNNASSNDAYLIKIPNSNEYIQQGLHNLIDVNYRDYQNYQCEIYLSKDSIEKSKYYNVYYNYRYSDYLKPHGYSLIEIDSDATFYFGQQISSYFLHLYGYKYITYGTEVISEYTIYSSFYFNVYAVENFNKMKVIEYDIQYKELKATEVKNGDIYNIKPETYQLKLYYSSDDSTWYESNFGTFMFGSSEPRTLEIKTQIINKDGYIESNQSNIFYLVR